VIAPETFETERLRAERVREEHLEPLRTALDADLRVMATLGGRLLTEEESRASMDRHLAHWERHGFGLWIFRGREGSGLVGRGGLLRFDLDGEGVVGLLYHVVAREWGKGYATEIARTCLRIGLERLGLRSIGCWTLPGNAASKRVMEKCGFTFDREGLFRGLTHHFYRITTEAWRSRRASSSERGAAPTTLSTSLPPRKKRRDGIPWTP
jgi:RimJ/RimL family protein N-acetyltransferase